MAEQKRGPNLRYPVIHRRKVPFRPHIEVSEEFAHRVTQIRQLDSELDRFFPSLKDYFDLIEEAYASNIHFSTKLEGNPLPLDAVRKLTRRSLKEGVPEKKPDFPTQEIINHLFLWLSPETMQPPWTLNQLSEIHQALLLGVSADARPGKLRDHEGAIYSDQGEEVFKTCPPKHIEEELGSLLEWNSRTAPSLDPVAGAAVFFHEFEGIHPFSDGNGRIGRTLFHSYLQHRGLPNAHLCLVERELLAEPEDYYRVLGWTDQEGSYGELLDFFSKALERSYIDAVERFRKKDLLSSKLPENLRRLLVNAKHEEGWFSVSSAASWIQGTSEQTIRNGLNELVDLKFLETIGKTRAKRYRFVSPLDQIKSAVRGFLKALGPKKPGTGKTRSGAGKPKD